MPTVRMETILLGLLERMDIADLAEVCDTLVWKVEDNGTEIFDVCLSWLSGDDPKLIEAALAINEGFLFKSREDMEEAFDDLARRLPQFQVRTGEILRNWDDKFKTRAIQDAVRGTRPLRSVARIYGVSEERLQRWVDEYRRTNPSKGR